MNVVSMAVGGLRASGPYWEFHNVTNISRIYKEWSKKEKMSGERQLCQKTRNEAGKNITLRKRENLENLHNPTSLHTFLFVSMPAHRHAAHAYVQKCRKK